MRTGLIVLCGVLVVMLAAACGGAEPASVAPAEVAVSEEVQEVEVAEKVAPAPLGKFVKTGGMTSERTGHRALLLPDGRVFVAGGRGKVGTRWGPIRHETAEVYDPATGEWTTTASMAKKREAFSLHLLDDGRVMVSGGRDQSRYHKKTEMWDPATDEWTLGPNMAKKRFDQASVKLPDGRLLISGGTDEIISLISLAEFFDPTAGEMGEWSPAGEMTQARAEHTATLLKDGRVLIVGGGKGGLGQEGTTFDTAEVWDPESNAWSPAGTLSVGRAGHTATLLNDGRVIVTGSKGKVTTAEIYDPASGEWSLAGEMSEWRVLHSATLLTDGRVMVAGGLPEVSSTDIYDPATGTWTTGTPLRGPRYGQTSTILNDNRVLLAGGNSVDSSGDRNITADSEIYEP